MIKKDDIMKIYQPDEEKMIAFGFEKLGHVYRYRKSIYDNKFYYEFVIGENQFSVEVFDAGFDEPYDLFSIGTAAGDFIMMLRNESEIIIKQIIEECFFKVDAKEKILEYIEQNFDAIKDHPFAQYPNYTVFKIPGHEKWFSIIMEVSLRQLGGEGEELVDVVNLKLDPKIIEQLIDFKTYFPAYHMNKTHWVSVVLTYGVDWPALLEYIGQSYHNVK